MAIVVSRMPLFYSLRSRISLILLVKIISEANIIFPPGTTRVLNPVIEAPSINSLSSSLYSTVAGGLRKWDQNQALIQRWHGAHGEGVRRVDQWNTLEIDMGFLKTGGTT